MSLSFEESAKRVRQFKIRPTERDLLKLYGLYKQANLGDNVTKKPWAIDVKGRKKWEAWDYYEGTSKDKAKLKYIRFVEKLIQAGL